MATEFYWVDPKDHKPALFNTHLHAPGTEHPPPPPPPPEKNICLGFNWKLKQRAEGHDYSENPYSSFTTQRFLVAD